MMPVDKGCVIHRWQLMRKKGDTVVDNKTHIVLEDVATLSSKRAIRTGLVPPKP
jgi:hypothetical protein